MFVMNINEKFIIFIRKQKRQKIAKTILKNKAEILPISIYIHIYECIYTHIDVSGSSIDKYTAIDECHKDNIKAKNLYTNVNVLFNVI